jgi:signal transduction histidine kinase/ActR/RegA family two-component response regulator
VSWGGQHADFWMNKEWTLVIRDITEARRLQQQLIRSEKLSAVGQLISGIAHELNNPLQAVVGYSDILGDDVRQKSGDRAEGAITVDAKEVLNDLRIITENAMRCQKIIENLLLFVRQGEIEKKAVDLAKVVQSSRELLQYKLKKAAHIQVDVEFPDPCPKVRGNFQQIQQVFVNLMNNACDAMIAAGGDRPKALRIAARETVAGVLRVEIADTGPGIPTEAREHVFEPFFTTKPEGRGTGLGLPVCRQIVEEHGGRLDFVTEVNRGTTFWFELPVAKDELTAAPGTAAALPPVRGRTILLVDDEPDVLGFLSKAIQAEGNTLDVAGGLRDAIARAAARPYDLVISDVRLGEGTGLSLYENWGLWTSQPRPPFLFMTGDVLNGPAVLDIEKKGLPLLRKPIDLLTFQNAVRRILSAALNNPPSKS